MGKTSVESMKSLNKKLQDQIEKLEAGKLELSEIEEMVNDARELYERLLILKYKAYEKFGEPIAEKEEKPVQNVKPVQEPIIEEVKEEPKPLEESSFDFSDGISEEEVVEQPAFDFSMDQEIEMEKSEDISVKTHEEPTDHFPEDTDIKTNTSDIFKESHVERFEKEDGNSLNEKLKTEQEESLRKKLQRTPVSDLRSEISIAKKFEYITFMFEGKNEKYEEAINSLNNCSDGEEARDKLNEYSTQYNWDLENKSIMKFVELVERRYL